MSTIDMQDPARERDGDRRIGPRLAGAATCALALLGAACASQRPVLYPNTHYHTVGKRAAEADVDWCLQYARDHGAGTGAGGRTAGRTARGAAVGGATGAAVGAVTGDLGTGAAAGAAGGAAAGFTRSLFDTGKPDTVHKRFVERCLRDLGYQPVGWR